MKSKVRGRYGHRSTGNVKQHLLNTGPSPLSDQALGQNRGTSQDERLSKGQLSNAQQDKEEID